MKGPLTISLLLLVGCDAISQGADEQILIHVFINNKPAALAFDTGAGVPAIFQSAAQRLGLQISNPPPDIGVAPAHGIYRQTESCKVATQLGEFETRFYVLEGQSAAVADGLFPWRWLTGRVLRINAFLLEAGGGCLELLSSLPPEVKSWTRLNVRTNEGVLTLEIPGSAPSTSIVLDTGFRGGVGLHSS